MDNLNYIKEKLGNSFDVKLREINTIVGKATLVFIDDLSDAKNISQYVIEPLRNRNTIVKDEKKQIQVEDIVEQILDINMTGIAKDCDDAIFHVLSGDPIIVFEKYNKIIFCEAKNFPRRGVGIPETEAVLKGPREGFNELIVDNVALIRRRIRNENLRFEAIYIGDTSQTAVSIVYINDIAPKELVDQIRNIVKGLDLRFILDTNYIEAALRKKHSFFDTIGYTEKPDEVCAKLLEGRIGVIVDGTPFVITAPYFFLENFQMPDDYYLNKYFSNLNRTIRWIAFFLAMFTPGLYVAISTHHFSMMPSLLVFRLAVSRAGVPIPTFLEVIIMMLAFQLIKEAGLRMPHAIGGAMSIVSGLILGDAAVNAGIASRITIIIVALSTLSYFLIPKLYAGLTVWSFVLVIFSAILGLPGFFAGSLLALIQISNLETCGYSFLFPIGSVTKYKFRDTILRGDLDRISNKIIGCDKDEDNEKAK